MEAKHQPLNCDPNRLRYRALVGVGGVGFGSFFLLSGNHTLGREESRGGRFLDRRDYCKLHIISHYVKVLLGRDFAAYPVGRVGDDEAGQRVTAEMTATGYDMRFMRAVPGEQTLYSFCFFYPDGCGGNLTTEDSACARMTPAMADEAAPLMAAMAGKGVALAAPEVPLSVRQRLLELATEHGFFRAAAFTSGEMADFLRGPMPSMVDLLAINIDEAAAISGLSTDAVPPEQLIAAALGKLRARNPCMMVSITFGARGSWLWDGHSLLHRPAIPVNVIGTSGAGDSHLGGLIVGLACGLTPGAALELATLVAAHTVTSPHTIDDRLDRDSLRAFAQTLNVQLQLPVEILLG